MLRSRLASLALACGLLAILSGCRSSSSCEDDRFFSRLFRSNSNYQGSGGGIFAHHHRGGASGPECECNQGHGQMPGIFDTAAGHGAHGPVMMTPTSSHPVMPIPITNVPTNQAPQVFKLPQAAPTPYIPTP